MSATTYGGPGGLSRGRASLAGAVSAGWLGMLAGLVAGIVTATGDRVYLLGVDGLLWGAVLGAVVGLLAQVTERRSDREARRSLAAAVASRGGR